MKKIKKALLLAFSAIFATTLLVACGETEESGSASSSSSVSVDASTPVEGSSQTAESSDVAESSTSVESSDVAESSTSVESSEVTESSTSVESSEVTESSTPVESSEVTESSTPVESSEVTESSTPVESSETPDSSTSVESSEGGVVLPEDTDTFTKVIDQKDAENGTIVEKLEVGEALDLTAPAPVDGKTFDGWFYADGTEVAEGTLKGESAVTIYAHWTVIPYTVTLMLGDVEYATLTFGVEEALDADDNEIIAIENIVEVLEAMIPVTTREFQYSIGDMPSTWALQNYTLTIVAEKIADGDLSGDLSYFERLNKLGKNNNYWDGASNVVSVENQKATTNGSDFATKLTFNPTLFTAEQLAAGKSAWAAWNNDMWVTYGIPVSNLDMTNYRLTFDIKFDNVSTKIFVLAAQMEGKTISAISKDQYFMAQDQEALEDGWYRFNVVLDTTAATETTAADYILLGFMNEGMDKTSASTVYVDNFTAKYLEQYEVTIKTDEDNATTQTVIEGTAITLETPKKDGYTFLGWVDEKGDAITSPYVPTADVVITAQWEKTPLGIGKSFVSIPDDVDYVEVTFRGTAGSYNVSTADGLLLYAINDGVLDTSKALSTFTLADNGDYTFAVYVGENLEFEGTILITRIREVTGVVAAVNVINTGYLGTSLAKGTLEEGVTAPSGFEKIYKYDSSTGWTISALPSAHYNRDDISGYEELWFAMRLENAKFYKLNGLDYDSSEWLDFHFTKTGTDADGYGIWDLVVSCYEKVVMTKTDISGAKVNANMPGDTLSTLLYKGGADTGFLFYHNGEGRTVSLYTTEIRGIAIPVEDDGGDEETNGLEKSTKITDPNNLEPSSIMGGYLNNQLKKNADTGSVTAPTGFESVIRYDSTEGFTSSIVNIAAFNRIDVSGYTDVYFAVYVSGGFVRAPGTYTTYTDTWLYFHLEQVSDGVWNRTITLADGTFIETRLNISGTHSNAKYSNTLAQLLGNSTWGTAYEYDTTGNGVANTGTNNLPGGIQIGFPSGVTSLSVYSTELRGIAKVAEEVQ